MKKHAVLIGNLLLILTGLIGLKAPYISALDMDDAFFQPVYIVFLIIALYGQIIKVKDTLRFSPLILQLIFGIVGFFYIFPFQNQIVGYVCLAGVFVVTILPSIEKFLRRKKIVTIKV